MAKKIIVTGDQYYGIDGKMLEIKRQLRLKGGSSLDPELVDSALQNIIEGRFSNLRNTKKQEDSSILRVVSSGEKLMIEVLDGKASILDAKKVFKSCINGDFKIRIRGFNQSGSATAETVVDVSALIKDATFGQIFTSITPDLDKIVMSQAQIIRFCEKYPTCLRQKGYATFFLTKVGDDYFVVSVRVYDDGLEAGVHQLEDDGVWHGEYRHRVVSPQLVP